MTSLAHFEKVAKSIETDACDIPMPSGGFKQSGIGREMGRAALDLFTETKAVLMAV